jgi:H+/Cl- antiporter ClcA
MPRRQWRRSARQLRSKQIWWVRLLFWSGAVLIGVVATALATASEYASSLVLTVAQTWPWVPLVLTPAGLVLIAWLTRRFFPAAEGSGIPQAIAMLEVSNEARRQEILGLGTGLFKGLMIILGIACGASIGREGPTVHIATAISYSLSHIGRFRHFVRRRRLILAGAAAGLSAAFNTPLAGAVFAIEEMSRSFEARTSGVVFMAVIVAGMTALALQGNYSYFGSVSVPVEPLETVGAVLLCGFVGGLLGGLFSSLLIHGGTHLAWLRRAHPFVFAAICGLLLALIGLLSGGMTYGTGYEQAKLALTAGEGGGLFAPLLKLVATLISYLSGIPGGIFAPSLSAGATLGVELAPLLPSVPVAAVSLLSMAAYFAGVVQSPMTTVVIIMEMTDEQHILLPLMATVLLAQWVSRHVCPRPIYLALADDFLQEEKKRPCERILL